MSSCILDLSLAVMCILFFLAAETVTGKSLLKKSRYTMSHTYFYLFYRQSGNTPVYNFEDLDVLIDQLWQLRLKPGFEIMGNPSNFFTDMENKTQVYLWKDLVHQIAARYVGKCAIKGSKIFP